MVRVHPTSTASVVQSHLSRAVRCWGQPTMENLLSPEREESATVHAASVLPYHLSGTIYHDTSETMTLVVNNSLAIWIHFCLHGPIPQRRLWERLFKRRFINGLTYLLTLILSNNFHSRPDKEQLPSFTQRLTAWETWLTHSIWVTDSRILCSLHRSCLVHPVDRFDNEGWFSSDQVIF